MIDAQGVIRYKNTRGPAMDKAGDALLEEMEEAGEKVAQNERANDALVSSETVAVR